MKRLFLIVVLFLLSTLLTYAAFLEQINVSSETSEINEVPQTDGKAPLILTFEPEKVYIAPATSEEGESIMFNLELSNSAPFKITIKKFFIRFLQGENLLAEKEQKDSFFRHGLIERKRKIAARSSIKWSGICLTADSFASVDRVEMLFHLKGRRKFKTTQVLEIPVKRYLQKTKLRLPVKGIWKITQGHTCRSNHRLSGYGGDFAWDFAALGKDWATARPGYFQSKANEDVYGFGRDVLAPAAGNIVKLVNDIPDNAGRQEYPRKSISDEVENPLWAFGNFIIIDHKNGEYSLLAHLKMGSIVVKKGDEVQTGQMIARCGNSGNTKVPHLHYQLMSGDNPIKYEVNGLPALVSNYYKIIHFPKEFPQSLEAEDLKAKIIKVLNGDPSKNTIIYALD